MEASELDDLLSEPASSVSFERIANVRPRSRSTVCGMVVRVRTRSTVAIPAVEVAVEDPSGTAFAVWPGRRSVAGVGLGRRILIEGVAAPSARGPVFTNPSYRLLPDR